MSRFDGKACIVSGATQGLGEAVAHRFAADGAAGVIVVGRNEERGRAVVDALSGFETDARLIIADLGRIDDCRRVVAEADDAFGRIDVLVNAAAYTVRGTIADTSPELFDQMLAVNLRAPFLLMQGVIEIMRREGIPGSIVNIGSQSGYGGQPYLMPYVASKGGLMALTKNVAYSVMWDRIRVNCLNLGWMDTAGEDVIQRRFHSDGQDWLEAAEAQQPFGRLIKPDEAAMAVAFLASDDSGLMTGALVDFNQGIIGAGDPPIPTRDETA